MRPLVELEVEGSDSENLSSKSMESMWEVRVDIAGYKSLSIKNEKENKGVLKKYVSMENQGESGNRVTC